MRALPEGMPTSIVAEVVSTELRLTVPRRLTTDRAPGMSHTAGVKMNFEIE